MSTTPHYAFPLIAEGQNAKYLTHNDALAQIDTVLFGLVGAPATPGIVLSTGTTFGILTVDPTLSYASSTLALNLAHTNAWTKAQRATPVTLTDAATITPDFAAANNFAVTLGGDRTLANPTNVVAGQAGQLVVTQDGTGSRTLAFGTSWKFAGGAVPTLSSAAGAIDILSYYVIGSGNVAVSGVMNFS